MPIHRSDPFRRSFGALYRRRLLILLGLVLAVLIVITPTQPTLALTTGSAATVVYGQSDFTSRTAGTSATMLTFPYGIASDANGLYVADDLNNRVLFYPFGSTTATRVYGQPDFTSHNNPGTPSATSLTMPSDVAVDATGLYVVDGANRVLFFPGTSTTATRVYGQPNFTSSAPGTSATGLHSPGSVAVASDGVYVADYENNRVLFYPGTSTTPTRVYGQADFTSNSPGIGATGLERPLGLTVDASGLYVSDADNNRVLFYSSGSTTASRVYGQPDFASRLPATSATGLFGPRFLMVDQHGLFVVDGYNNRLLFYPGTSTTATQVYGQPDFTSNAYGTSATALSGPGGVTLAYDGALYVSDGYNNRVLIVDDPVSGLQVSNDGPGHVGSPVALQATVATGTRVTYSWDFGDGQTSTGTTTQHTYQAAGSYTIQVTATNGLGSSTATTTVQISATPPANQLRNGGFEWDLNHNGQPDWWSANPHVTRSSAVVHSGRYAMQHSANDNATYAVEQTISPVQAGASYDVGAWVNIPTTSDAFSFQLSVQWRDGRNAVVGTHVVKSYTAATTGWDYTSAGLVAPTGATQARVIMTIKGLTGTIYVDDVAFTP